MFGFIAGLICGGLIASDRKKHNKVTPHRPTVVVSSCMNCAHMNIEKVAMGPFGKMVPKKWSCKKDFDVNVRKCEYRPKMR